MQSVCTGNEQSAASKSRDTIAVVAPPTPSPRPPSLHAPAAASGSARPVGDAAAGGARVRGGEIANLVLSSSSTSSVVSVAGGEPTAQLPAPAAREESRRASSPSASGGESQAQFKLEAVSPAATAAAAGDAASVAGDAAAARMGAKSPSTTPSTAMAATAVGVERTAATPASTSAGAAAAAAADPTSRWLCVKVQGTELVSSVYAIFWVQPALNHPCNNLGHAELQKGDTDGFAPTWQAVSNQS